MDNYSALLGKKLAGSGSGSGTSNYNELENKPQINGNTLTGNKTAANLGLQSAINLVHKLDADLIDDSESEKKLVSENDISNWNNKYDSDDAYTKAQTDTAIETAINTLDAASAGGSGKYIKEISQTDGVITPVEGTIDSEPTANSTNPVTSGGVAASQAAQDAEIARIDATAAALQNEIDYAINTGAKNMIKIASTTKTINGVTFTVNADRTITMNGTSQERAQFLLRPNAIYAGMQGYILNGAVQNDQDITLRFQLGANPWTVYASDSGSGAVIQNYNDNSLIQVYINVPAGVTVSNLVFKPMIRPASITDSTFQPYALPNPTLTPAAIKAVDEGAKNVAQTNDVTKTGDGFVNTDPISGDLFVSAATVSTTASSSTFAVVFYYTDGTISASKQLPVTNSLAYEFNTGEKVVERVRIFAGNTAEASSGKTITLTNFMICTAADWVISKKFVPYSPTNRELYETKADKSIVGLKLVLSRTMGSTTAVRYTMDKNDFIETSPTLAGSIGTYIISIMPWSLTPNFSLYSVSYTGGSFDYTSITKIAGADRTVTVENGVISVSGLPSNGGKVSIHAML